MKSELFVVNTVMSSEQAFSAVAELIPSLDVRELLKILQHPDKLRQAAAHLRVEYREIFAHLEKAIVDAFNRQGTAHLTRKHLRLVQTADVQYDLSELLGCKPNSALQTLFSVPDLQETLEYLSAGSIAPSSNVAQLLSEIIRPNHVQQLELDYATNENDWECIVDGERWLATPATAALMKSVISGGGEITPSRALAEFIDRTVEDKSETERLDLTKSGVIGPFGLIEFRRRLTWMQETLRQEIIDCGERAVMSLPDSPSVKMLLPVLQIYEFGNIAQGLQTYFNQGHVLRDLLPEDSIERVDIDEEEVVQDGPLIFSPRSQYGVAREQVGTFDILCSLSHQRQPQIFLHVSNVKGWVYRQLSEDIPKLTPNKLSRIGDVLHERLLNTSFPLVDPKVRHLKDVIEELGPAFIRALILCSETPIDRIPDLFRGKLSQRPPYKEMPSTTDPLYRQGVEDIIALHRTTYRNSLRIERGSDPSDSSTQI